MKIIYYSPHPYLNLQSLAGYGTHMREMINAFEELGHEVLPVIAGGTDRPEKKLTVSPASSLKTTIKKLIPSLIWQSLKDYGLLKFDRLMQKKLKNHLVDFQPDFVFERLNYMQLSGVNACEEMGVCHFSEANSPYVKEKITLEGNTLYKNKAYQIERIQLEKTNKAFAVTNNLAQYLKAQHLDENSNRIEVLPNAIDPEKFMPIDRQVQAIKAKLNITANEQIIGFVGSIFRWHRVDILIEAFSKICKRIRNVRLLIVGDGESLIELKELAQNLNILERVIFVGSIPHREIPNYVELMDITVMANTNWYCSPIKIFEYGALKKAIVAPNSSAIKDVMIANEHALLVEPNNIESLETALIRLLEDDNLRTQLGANFYIKVITNHTWKKNAQVVLNEFKNNHSVDKK